MNVVGKQTTLIMPKFNVSNMNFYVIGNQFGFTMSGPIIVQAHPKITYCSRTQPVYYDPSHQDKKLWKAALVNTIKSNQVCKSLTIFTIEKFANDGIELVIKFYEKRPKLDFNKQGQLKQQNHKFPYHHDVDNMVKFVMDEMLGIAYKDNSSVVKIVCEKLYLVSEDIAQHDAEQELVIVIINKK